MLRSVNKKPDGLASIVGAESIHEFMYVTASCIGSTVDIENIVLIFLSAFSPPVYEKLAIEPHWSHHIAI